MLFLLSELRLSGVQHKDFLTWNEYLRRVLTGYNDAQPYIVWKCESHIPQSDTF
jgi:hypothetical protein